MLAPLPSGSPLERLRAAGAIDDATGSVDDLPEPLVLSPGTELPSEGLKRLRRDER